MLKRNLLLLAGVTAAAIPAAATSAQARTATFDFEEQAPTAFPRNGALSSLTLTDEDL